MENSRFERLRHAVSGLAADAWTKINIAPESEVEAAMAVALLGELLDAQTGSKHQALLGQLDNADMLSSDPLQVLSELVQNADDAGAAEIRFRLDHDQLVVAHDGRPVELRDLQFLALPGLSGKRHDAQATGRFGIGLSTIRSLTNVWEIHQGQFHVQVTGSSVAPVAGFDNDDLVDGPLWTVFRIPLTKRTVTPRELDRWFGKWNNAALLFLRSVRTISVMARSGTARVLSLTVRGTGSLRAALGSNIINVNVARVEFPDGAMWHLFQADVPVPGGLARRHKSTAETMPLGVGLPDAPIGNGVIHAGLPVADIPVMTRVNALFETLTNRQDFIDGDWNAAVCELGAKLWAVAVQHVLEQINAQAWHLVPVAVDSQPSGAGLPDQLTGQMLQLARTMIAPGLRVQTPRRTRRRLSELAVEEEVLTPVVSGSNIAAVAGLPAVFPSSARDDAGRWRTVVSDWRQASRAAIRKEVTVTDALALLRGSGYPVADMVKLAACAIERRVGHLLEGTRCLVSSDGTRHTPPAKGELAMVYSSPAADMTLLSELPITLGFGITLHDAYYTDTADATTVRKWLRDLECMADRGDARALLNRVAAFAQKGGMLPDPPRNDEALRALLTAMRQVDERHRRRIGAEIGKALKLKAISYNEAGDLIESHITPAGAYLPVQLDSRQRSFSEAADVTPGMLWISPEYRKTLRTRGDDHGLPIGGFFRLLGVADTPRLDIANFGDNKEYVRDPRSGFPAYATLSTPERNSALDQAGANHTLDDQYSRHIEYVARSIAADLDGDRRRRRALALLDTLRRANLLTGSAARVKAASANYAWDPRGSTWPLWAWRLRTIAWVDDIHGHPTRPDRLHHRTKAAVAIYGTDNPGYLHPAFNSFATRHADCLPLLGIAGNPTRTQLIKRLRDLKKRSAHGKVTDQIRAEVHVVYQVLEQELATKSENARTAPIAPHEQLILSDQGWRSPSEVFQGRSILAGYRPYVPADEQLMVLWTTMNIRHPSVDDVLEVLKTIAGKGQRPSIADQTVVLEGLRHLNTLLTAADPKDIEIGLRSSIRALPIWTSNGWSKQRPRYVTNSRDLASRLSARLTMWEPGGQLDLSPETLRLLDVTPIDLIDATVDTNLPSTLDEDLTDRYRRTIVHFQDEIARYEPQAADTFTGWSWLTNLDVHLTPGLRITFPIKPEVLMITVRAHINKDDGVLHLNDHDEIRTAGGEAIAAYFATAGEHVAMRWTRMWDQGSTREAPTSKPMITSQQRELLARQKLAEQLSQRPQSPHETPAPIQTPAPSVATPQPKPSVPPQAPAPIYPTRQLVDLQNLELDSPVISSTGNSHTRNDPPTRRDVGRYLPEPRPDGAAPRQHLGPRAYTDLERETLALNLLRAVLRQHGLTLHDYRAQSGLGADATDSAGGYYEIKAHAGPEPDAETISMSQLQRAYQNGRSFNLVIASNLEYGNGDPTLRIIKDPLRVLAIDTQNSIRLHGLHKPDLPAVEIIFTQRRDSEHDIHVEHPNAE